MINSLEKKLSLSLILTLAIAIEIFWFSSIPGSPSRGGLPIFAIMYHFLVFFLLAFFLTTTIKGQKKIGLSILVIILTLALIYAASDEYHQKFVPGRSANIEDFLTDSLGIFSSTLLYLYIESKRIKISKDEKTKSVLKDLKQKSQN